MQRRRYINGLIKYKQTGLSKVQFSRCNTAVARCFQCRTSGPTNENNEDLNEFCLLLKGKKTLSERDIYHQALKLEEQEKEQRMANTEEQLKSLRIELQKSQERREQRRIQQETAKVFTGTVIHRRRNISDDDRRINRPKGFLPPWKKSRRRLSMEEMKDLEDDIECPETAEQFCQKMYHEAHQEPNLIPPYIPQQQSSTICQKIRKFARWLFSFCCWPLSF